MNNPMYEEILERLRKRGFKGQNGDDYVKAGVVDSLGLLGWVLELEDVFGVELTDDDVASDGFRIADGLARIIEGKLK